MEDNISSRKEFFFLSTQNYTLKRISGGDDDPPFDYKFERPRHDITEAAPESIEHERNVSEFCHHSPKYFQNQSKQ